MVREKGLEPSRPKTQVPKTCVSAISPLPRKPCTNAVARGEDYGEKALSPNPITRSTLKVEAK
jgi:hypothetical protein